jgi:hypothetical protein
MHRPLFRVSLLLPALLMFASCAVEAPDAATEIVAEEPGHDELRDGAPASLPTCGTKTTPPCPSQGVPTCGTKTTPECPIAGPLEAAPE